MVKTQAGFDVWLVPELEERDLRRAEQECVVQRREERKNQRPALPEPLLSSRVLWGLLESRCWFGLLTELDHAASSEEMQPGAAAGGSAGWGVGGLQREREQL